MSGTTAISSPVSGDILIESVHLSQDLLVQIFSRFQQLPDLTLEKQISINQWVSSLTMDVGNFVEITTLFTRLLQKRLNQTLTGARDSHIHLLFVMKGINSAQQKGDMVALEELIKYELKDNLTQWKIDLIPQAKRLLLA